MCGIEMEQDGATSGISRRVIAIEDFIAQTDHDLAFVTGDHIQLLKFADENWGVGRLRNGRQGIFPICFTAPLEHAEEEEEVAPPPPIRHNSIKPPVATIEEHEKENKFSKLSNHWKRSKSPETEPKVRNKKKLTTLWKEPDIKRLSADLGAVQLRNSPTKSKVRPKSYAEPSYVMQDSEAKRRSYQAWVCNLKICSNFRIFENFSETFIILKRSKLKP